MRWTGQKPLQNQQQEWANLNTPVARQQMKARHDGPFGAVMAHEG